MLFDQSAATTPRRRVAMTNYSSNADPDDVRTAAIHRLRERSEFAGHLRAYVSFRLFLTVLWAIAGGAFFWPAIPMVCWGIWVAVHAARLIGSARIAEADIQREMQRLSVDR